MSDQQTRNQTMTQMTNACETHDQPGACTQECADLVADMMGDAMFDPNESYDPTGCRTPRPMPYDVAEYDAENRRVVIRTEHPEDCACGDIHNEEERAEREHGALVDEAKALGLDPYVVTRPWGETGPVMQGWKDADVLRAEIDAAHEAPKR